MCFRYIRMYVCVCVHVFLCCMSLFVCCYLCICVYYTCARMYVYCARIVLCRAAPNSYPSCRVFPFPFWPSYVAEFDFSCAPPDRASVCLHNTARAQTNERAVAARRGNPGQAILCRESSACLRIFFGHFSFSEHSSCATPLSPPPHPSCHLRFFSPREMAPLLQQQS